MPLECKLDVLKGPVKGDLRNVKTNCNSKIAISPLDQKKHTSLLPD